MAKQARERAVKERRALKLERKREAAQRRLDGLEPVPETDLGVNLNEPETRPTAPVAVDEAEVA